jgi:hypothetical protein
LEGKEIDSKPRVDQAARLQALAKVRHCERSEAIQLATQRKKLDCFVASAPRNDDFGSIANDEGFAAGCKRVYRSQPSMTARRCRGTMSGVTEEIFPCPKQCCFHR